MFYHLYELRGLHQVFNLFQYITFRAVAGAGTAFVLSVLLGPSLIRILTRLRLGQPIRRGKHHEVLEDLHGGKAGTPTMGGWLILATVTLASVLWARPGSVYPWLVLAMFWVMGLIGFWDDWLKVSGQDTRGLRAWQKMAVQALAVAVLCFHLHQHEPTRERLFQLMVPFFKDPLIWNMGLIPAFLFVFLVVVGSANAVNLTDGLDGLAIGCSGSVALAYGILAYVAGHAIFAQHLLVPYVPGTGELAVFCACLLGGCLGFLWFNCHPAQMFMGDTGSLALGGAIATVAVLVKHELTLLIAGAVFVAEALSVMIQVASFRTTGRRVFLCAPLHHHFEHLERRRAQAENRPEARIENRIVVRLWIVSIICALAAVATLKIR